MPADAAASRSRLCNLCNLFNLCNACHLFSSFPLCLLLSLLPVAALAAPDPSKTESIPPKSPQDTLATITTKPGLRGELVAAEPLIVDPVAIDWGPDGKLWVVEMRDYPMGMDGKWKPGSRVKYLEDTNGDGKYDKATVFVDNLPFATGVMAWRKGALICAAPDILYGEE